MTFTIHDPDLGPATHTCAGLRAMRERIWSLAASGVLIIIEQEREF